MNTMNTMGKYDNVKYMQAWRRTGIKDFTGSEFLLTRFERVQIVRVKMNRMYTWMVTSLKGQLPKEVK